MEHSVFSGHAKNGTVGGMLVIFLTNITSGDLVKTIVLAATGAAVSFVVSWGLKATIDKLNKRE